MTVTIVTFYPVLLFSFTNNRINRAEQVFRDRSVEKTLREYRRIFPERLKIVFFFF